MQLRRRRLVLLAALATSGCAALIGLEEPEGALTTPEDGGPTTGEATTPPTVTDGSTIEDGGLPAPDGATLFALQVDPAWNGGVAVSLPTLLSMDVFDELDGGVYYAIPVKANSIMVYALASNGSKELFPLSFASGIAGEINEAPQLVASLGPNELGVSGFGTVDGGAKHWFRRYELDGGANGLLATAEDASVRPVDMSRDSEGFSFVVYDLDGGSFLLDSTLDSEAYPGFPIGVFGSQGTTADIAAARVTVLAKGDAGYELQYYGVGLNSKYTARHDQTDASGAVATLDSVALAHGALIPWLAGASADGTISIGSILSSGTTMTPALLARGVTIRSAAKGPNDSLVAGGCITRDGGDSYPWLAAFQGTTYVEGSEIAALDFAGTCVESVRISPRGFVVVLLRARPGAADAGTYVARLITAK